MIVTYDETLKFLDLSPEDIVGLEKDLLQEYINGSQDIIEKYCNRNFEKQAYEELKDGNDSNIILLSNFPIDSSLDFKVYYKVDFDESFTEIESTSIIANYNNGITKTAIVLPAGFRNVKVEYTAGYENADIPSVVKLAIKSVAKTLFEKRDQNAVGLSDYHSGDAIIKYDAELIPLDIRKLLNTYKVWSFK